MVSVMLYPCIFCVALSMDLFVLCVACLTVFVNCLVIRFAICLCVFAILLLNVMELLCVVGGALLDNSSIWSPLTSSIHINKLQVMQNAALRTVTVCTQYKTYNVYDEEKTYTSHTQAHSSTRHNTNIKHKHTTSSTLQGYN